jgi:hypothetical protein
MVAELIGVPIRVSVVRRGEPVDVELVPAELTV